MTRPAESSSGPSPALSRILRHKASLVASLNAPKSFGLSPNSRTRLMILKASELKATSRRLSVLVTSCGRWITAPSIHASSMRRISSERIPVLQASKKAAIVSCSLSKGTDFPSHPLATSRASMSSSEAVRSRCSAGLGRTTPMQGFFEISPDFTAKLKAAESV